MWGSSVVAKFDFLLYKKSSFIIGGDVAQLVEHLLCKQGVAGSIPTISTNFIVQCRIFYPENHQKITAHFIGAIDIGNNQMSSQAPDI